MEYWGQGFRWLQALGVVLLPKFGFGSQDVEGMTGLVR